MGEIQNIIQSLVDGGFDISAIKDFFGGLTDSGMLAGVIEKITGLLGNLPIGWYKLT